MRAASAALAALLALAACTTTPRAPPAPAPPPAAPVPAPPAPPPELTIAAVGDIMLGTDHPQNILPDDDGAGFLLPATPLIAAADVSFGNLEGVLMDGGEPVKICRDPQRCHLFRTPTRYAQHLQDAGFDVLSLANNHARDFGEEGRDSSMRALDAAGILHSGREGTHASWTARGLNVALIAFAPNVGSNPLLDVDFARARVRELARGHDIVLVSFHAGAEGDGAERLPFAREFYLGEDRGDVVEFAHAMIEAGADLLLGHGPHVPRALELYRGRLIAYSLGNFATYYGIGVDGLRGLAPIVVARLDAEGCFLGGRIESLIQLRPGGPQPDPEARAAALMRELTIAAFPGSSLVISAAGDLSVRQPEDRGSPR